MKLLVLSRRNLLTLLNKLDANKASPGTSFCSLTMEHNAEDSERILVQAVEDEVKYAKRAPGPVLSFDTVGDLQEKVKIAELQRNEEYQRRLDAEAEVKRVNIEASRLQRRINSLERWR